MAALLTDSHRPVGDFATGFSPAAEVGGGDAVHVAVGRSLEKTMALLQWTCSVFPGREVVLLHVYRPSPFIPTPLGKLPASRANPDMLAAFRHEEREETMKLLSDYLTICSRSKVKASFVTTESDEVQRGILDLVNLHTINKLVVGAIPGFTKKGSCEASFLAKNAPSYCEMWYVNKRKLIWTRPASGSSIIHPQSCQLASPSAHNLASLSLNSAQTKFLKSGCDTIYRRSLSSSANMFPRVSSVSTKTLEEFLCSQLEELMREVHESRDEAFLTLLEPRVLEDEALEAFSKVKTLETSHSHEEKLRMEAEDTLGSIIQREEKLLEENAKLTQNLHKSMRNISVLDGRAHEAEHRCEEVAEELKLVQASVASLLDEKQKVQRQKNEAARWLDGWRNHEKVVIGSKVEEEEVMECDAEAATCNFCESLQIGQGEYGVVYKGEMSGRKVAVKKLHAHNMQRQAEFNTAVQVVGKLRHPHLVKLMGVCPESWCLVYEYLPGGSLQNYLSNKRNMSALGWKTRARIVADIASGLHCMHFSKPKVVHGNLKPENLFLDHENRCKISDYGDNMILPNRAFRCCSGSGGVCLYTDPESYKTGSLTHMSDIYSFGVIILQLVTGKTKGRIAGKVRRAVSAGKKIASLLDASAGDWSAYVGRRLVELGLQCCERNSRDRPEMTECLVKELNCMPFLEEQAVPSFFLCPILQEIMHDPHVAADGFTYEGEALRGWLQSGRETSPMTNLKLKHLDLTPNYSLRLAIQEWIANLQITATS
ncbi:U-box domain-containing protein 33 [Striga hermonthica]|uniref:RING-type E3 ubiquitin transferase n=1 Tax=Striga hermonthica TaxID=68872 RepID=A0A9N7MI38_STRHE|nr:U-box domain-containing protein 33 [Striga hermonthica]